MVTPCVRFLMRSQPICSTSRLHFTQVLAKKRESISNLKVATALDPTEWNEMRSGERWRSEELLHNRTVAFVPKHYQTITIAVADHKTVIGIIL